MNDATFVGLDGEMTGTAGPKAWETFQLVQAGFAVRDGDNLSIFASDIGYSKFHFQKQSLKVNGFTKERIRSGPWKEAVDANALNWFKRKGLIDRKLVAIGWNVAGFDMPFFREYLPRTTELFSYRTCDPNAIIFAYSQANGVSYGTVKKEAKNHGKREMKIHGHEANWHDAGYDAGASLYSFDFLCDLIEGRRTLEAA